MVDLSELRKHYTQVRKYQYPRVNTTDNKKLMKALRAYDSLSDRLMTQVLSTKELSELLTMNSFVNSVRNSDD